MGAHLHVVPDPEPDEEQGPGERPVLAAAPTVAVRRQQPDPDEDDEAGEYDEEDGGALAIRGYMTVPDLRPYVDPRPLHQLGPLAMEAGKTAGPPILHAIGWLLRALVHMVAWYSRGIGVLLVLLAGWLSGKFGKRGSLGARAGGLLFAGYVAVKVAVRYAFGPLAIGAVLAVAAALAAAGHIEVPADKSAKKPTGKKTGKAKEKTEPAPAQDPEARAEETIEASEDDAGEVHRARWTDRFRRRTATAAGPPASAAADAPDEDGEEPVDEDGIEASTEAPPIPSRDDLIRALHHLYQGGSGVLHTALAKHLSLPDTRAVKEALDEAGIPYRTGVRTPAGNGPGVHRDGIPPLPFSLRDPQETVVVAGQTANTNTNNAANNAEEEWTAEEIAKGYRLVQDHERGPAAWKVQHHEGR